jgi:hypothetical protein
MVTQALGSDLCKILIPQCASTIMLRRVVPRIEEEAGVSYLVFSPPAPGEMTW